MRNQRLTPLTRTAAALAFAAATAVAGAAPGDAPTRFEAIVQQPRAFGHTIGDLLSQRVLLQAGDHDFEPAALPGRERIGVWFERQPARIESGADGRRWLVVDYQLINAPQALRTVSLPAWELPSGSGGEALRIVEWPVSVAPLTPREAFTQGGMGLLRPDRPAPLVATAPMERWIRIWSLGLFLTLAAWLAWWLQRNWRASATRPFARALRELRSLDDDAPEAWQALHRAFDLTAGRVVQAGALGALFARAPWLEPLRSRIEAFYLQSRERFFGARPPAGALPLRTLCRDLRRIEKRQER